MTKNFLISVFDFLNALPTKDLKKTIDYYTKIIKNSHDGNTLDGFKKIFKKEFKKTLKNHKKSIVSNSKQLILILKNENKIRENNRKYSKTYRLKQAQNRQIIYNNRHDKNRHDVMHDDSMTRSKRHDGKKLSTGQKARKHDQNSMVIHRVEKNIVKNNDLKEKKEKSNKKEKKENIFYEKKENIYKYIQKKKENYRDNVKLTANEYQELNEELGEECLKKCLDKLSAYKLATGKNYKSDFGAIKYWVYSAVKKDEQKYNFEHDIQADLAWPVFLKLKTGYKTEIPAWVCTIRDTFGYDYLASIKSESLPFLKRDFVKIYNHLKNTGADIDYRGYEAKIMVSAADGR